METYASSNAMNKSMNPLRLHTLFISAVVVILMFGAQLLPAPTPESNRVTVPLTDPSRPAQVRAHLLHGSITVKSYEGKDALVEAKARGAEERDEKPERRAGGDFRP